VAWSDDSARILLTDSDGIWILGARDGRATRVTTSRQDDDPVVSPDGSHVAYVRGTLGLGDPARIAVYVVGADGRGRVRLGRGFGSRWSPDGRSVAFVEPPLGGDAGGRLASGRIRVAAPDGSTRRLVGLGTTPEWSPDGSSFAFMRYTFAPNEDGALVAAESTLLVVRADGSGSHELAHWDAALVRPRWSPDGTTILVEDSSLEAFELVDAATGERREVRHFGFEYAWSPSGDFLAFATYGQVGVVRPDGGGERILAHGLSTVRGPVWSPDGSRLAFVHCSDKCDIFSISVAGTGWRRVTHTPGIDGLPSWSR
jgi:Tol biopolymer transport system component